MKRKIKNKVIPEICSREYTPCVKTKRLISPTKTFGDDGMANVSDYSTRGRRYIKAFTLIELLVVVLIIGILSAVALPQYQRAVDKSRVATILPLMRRWIDEMALYKLEHGTYKNGEGENNILDALGVSWPQDWTGTEYMDAQNNLWYCFANEEGTGAVYCDSKWKKEGENFEIVMTQPDDTSGLPKGKRFCFGENESFCKSLGGKPIAGYPDYYEF